MQCRDLNKTIIQGSASFNAFNFLSSNVLS